MDFEKWCLINKIEKLPKEYIQKIRENDPVRKVQSRKKNIHGKFPSEKMGQSIQFESHTVELVGIYEMEHDVEVYEYYDQPDTIQLQYLSKEGNKVYANHTPDFFVIRLDSVGFEEWKSEDKLLELMLTQPNRYCKDDDGNWRCPPGEEYAAKFGFYYKLRSSSEINYCLQRNIYFLEDYYEESNMAIDNQNKSRIEDYISENQGVSLDRLLLVSHEYGISADDIYSLVVSNSIYINLYKYALAESEYALVYTDEQISLAYERMTAKSEEGLDLAKMVQMVEGNKILWNGNIWTIINVGVSNITLINQDGEDIHPTISMFESWVIDGKITNSNTQESTFIQGLLDVLVY